jgi:DNA-binding NarL/FixJ family response regulator
MTVIRVLLADDNPWVRESLAAVLAASGRIDVVAQCVDGTEVDTAVARTRPDVVMLDLAMPVVGGLEAARRLLARRPGTRIVLLTGSLSPAAVAEARRMGVCGYLLKEQDAENLVAALLTVAAGGSAWTPAAAGMA